MIDKYSLYYTGESLYYKNQFIYLSLVIMQTHLCTYQNLDQIHFGFSFNLLFNFIINLTQFTFLSAISHLLFSSFDGSISHSNNQSITPVIQVFGRHSMNYPKFNLINGRSQSSYSVTISYCL